MLPERRPRRSRSWLRNSVLRLLPVNKEPQIYSSKRASKEFKAKKGPRPTPPSVPGTPRGTRSEDSAPQGPAGSQAPPTPGPGRSPHGAGGRRGAEGDRRVACVLPTPVGRRRGAAPAAAGRGRSLPFPRVQRARWLSGHVPGPRRSVPAELTPSSLSGSGLRCRLYRRHEHLPPHRGLVPPGGHHHSAAQDLEEPLLRGCVRKAAGRARGGRRDRQGSSGPRCLRGASLGAGRDRRLLAAAGGCCDRLCRPLGTAACGELSRCGGRVGGSEAGRSRLPGRRLW